MEEVAASCTAVRFFQLYVSNIPIISNAFHQDFILWVWTVSWKVFRNREVSAWLVQRAERSGYKAIVVTVDTPKLGRREKDIKNKWDDEILCSSPEKEQHNHLISHIFMYCRMIAPQLKNLEGFMSTEVVNVCSRVPLFFWIL